MITPTFKLEQNNEYLFVNIRAPYANVKNNLNFILFKSNFSKTSKVKRS